MKFIAVERHANIGSGTELIPLTMVGRIFEGGAPLPPVANVLQEPEHNTVIEVRNPVSGEVIEHVSTAHSMTQMLKLIEDAGSFVFDVKPRL